MLLAGVFVVSVVMGTMQCTLCASYCVHCALWVLCFPLVYTNHADAAVLVRVRARVCVACMFGAAQPVAGRGAGRHTCVVERLPQSFASTNPRSTT